MKLNHIVITGLAIITITISRYFTAQGMFWYETLQLPWFVPPKWVFGLVWTTIYALTTAAVIMVWNRLGHIRSFWIVIGLFIVNACANMLWCYQFFVQHAMGRALATAIALEVSVLLLIVFVRRHSHTIAGLLIPYAFWAAFAIMLNYRIWQLN